MPVDFGNLTEEQKKVAEQGAALAKDPTMNVVRVLLGKYLQKMIRTQGDFALDAYLLTVLTPLADAIPLGEEHFLDSFQERAAEFIARMIEAEKEVREILKKEEGKK